MTKKSPKKLELSADEKKRVEQLKENKKPKVTPEWMFISEIGYHYGWGGVKAVMGIGCKVHDDGENPCECIDIDTALELLKGAKAVQARAIIDNSKATLTANAAIHSKNPAKVFKRGMNEYKERL